MSTNKIDLVRAEVEKLKSNLMYGACSSQIAMETMCKEEAYNEVLAILDTMQEEPVSEELEEAADNALSNVLNTHEIVNVRSCLEMFRLGAKWQRNSIWHDTSKMPKRNSLILLHLNSTVYPTFYEKPSRVYPDSCESVIEDKYEWDRMPFDKWCYFSDILPTKD